MNSSGRPNTRHQQDPDDVAADGAAALGLLAGLCGSAACGLGDVGEGVAHFFTSLSRVR